MNENERDYKELEKNCKEIYKILKCNYDRGSRMICPKCGQSRINKVAWEGDHLRRMACIICNGYYDIQPNMIPCRNCHHNDLIEQFAKDSKNNWLSRGQRVLDFLSYYSTCVECYTLRNHDRFFNYTPRPIDVVCDSCKNSSRNGQLYFVDHFYNDRDEKLAVCGQCKEEKFSFVNRKQFKALNERVTQLEEKLKMVSIVYCDNCGQKINLEEL